MSFCGGSTLLLGMTAAPNPLAAPEPWDLVSEGYEAVTRDLLTPYSERAIELLQPLQNERAIDVAAGPGTTSLLLAPRVTSVDSLDFSRLMLAQLDANVAAAGLTNVHSHHGDGQSLPFTDASFDLGVSMFGLMFFPDRRAGFRELRRVLAPGGRAVVSSWAPVDQSPSMRLLFGAFRAVNPERPEPQRDISSLENPDVFRAEMEEAGFSDVEIVEVESGPEPRTPEEFWRDTTRGAAPLVLWRKHVGEEAWAAVAEKALDYLRAEWQPGVRLTSTAYLGFGRVRA